ncbi:glycosyltransferase family 2 protein [Acetobacterium woodii]|uniref:Glycosyltransferase n=1 Tax=Acetobacterium woodii (strain ATCC 29683 / DSM 1030 / JCM 2381 / KCTC 1655 / WB1) TaxID=931626 RepID=H6LGB6_ACEWD|nr:glycosyltransferase family 2 protein [Acetobacterium woodii]AFA47052.1 glycosyltransferase [Acetobacterium woodii DSM 1030]
MEDIKKTAILIPCYNESKTIEKVIKDHQAVMPHAEIYVYDNNSSDGTDEIARNAGAIVRYEYRQGKGNVVRSMFRDIDADCYIMTDGDDTYPAEFALELEKQIYSERADMVIGDRLSSTYFTENKRPFHNIGNVLVRKLINVLFKAEVKDIMTGSRGFTKAFVKSFPVTSKGFEIETEMTIFALDNNFKIVEVPIDYRDRPEGSESKLNTYTDGYKVLRTIGTLFRDTKPYLFFSIISLMLLLIGGAFFVPILINYFETGTVAKYPTLIVITAMWIIAIISFFSGVILQVLKKQHRHNFERYLNMLNEIWRKEG